MPALELADEPLPERERLRVRIVHAEDTDALLRPEQHDGQELLPQLPPVLVLEVERVDVFVLLRRVLRVLDRAVGPVLEPFGVLARVRMVRRALECGVERDVQAVVGGCRPKMTKRTESGRGTRRW